MKKSGSSRRAFLAMGGKVIGGNGPAATTEPSTWYLILKKGETSSLPPEIPVNTVFRSPATAPQ